MYVCMKESVNLGMKNVKPSQNLPRHFVLLYKHADKILKESADSLQILLNAEVLGTAKTIFLLHENVIPLLEFKWLARL